MSGELTFSHKLGYAQIMKLVYLVTPKQAKPVDKDVLAEINVALRNRKLPKPSCERKLTALEWD
jgi:hypothetical protein